MTQDEWNEKERNKDKQRQAYLDSRILFYKTCPKCGKFDEFEESWHNHGRLVYRTCDNKQCNHTWEMKYGDTW